ncbi:MAG: MGMT family protein [Candidatus Omnitrophica bacterium]|nr:MGMT family protein [Candidatus Omnitrophota bacterium]MDD5671286.1 MGMT family protein [Candidatus Omnitrophota bacterium]
MSQRKKSGNQSRDILKVPVHTRWGTLELWATDRGLVRLKFVTGRHSRSRDRKGLKPQRPGPQIKHAENAIKKYFSGKPISFGSLKIDWQDKTAFERHVLHKLSEIGYGHVRTYRDLAGRAGAPKAARAVGSVMRKNPLPIILPCHRVIRSDGSLGGYSGGLKLKKRLLDLEKRVSARRCK